MNSSKKISVITTFNDDGYNLYGKTMVDSFSEYWDKDIDLHVYYEGSRIDIDDPRIHMINIEDACPDLMSFKNRHKDNAAAKGETKLDPNDNSRKPKGLGYRWDSIRFSHKSYVVTSAASSVESDIIIWIDADTKTFRNVEKSFVENILPESDYCGYLGRPNTYSECGFLIFNTSHHIHEEFMKTWKDYYDNDTIFSLDEWHDSFVFDVVRHEMTKKGVSFYNISQTIPNHCRQNYTHPFINSILGEYMDHLKGPRKETGKSKSSDIKVSRYPPYWNNETTKKEEQDVTSKPHPSASKKPDIISFPHYVPSHIKYSRKTLQRYNQLYSLIKEYKPSSILEVGTYDGNRAINMMKEAIKYVDSVHYTGYDLFDDMTPIIKTEELNGKKYVKFHDVHQKLDNFVAIQRQQTGKCLTFDLIKGNIRETLRYPTYADFVFIDGGHSIETIRSDYLALRKSPVIVFDDYYDYEEDSKSRDRIHDISKFGCNKIVEKIKKCKLMSVADKISDKGAIRFALVVDNALNAN